MLTLLHIENIAVVERADIEFGEHFNVLTGETGAGKSIIVDAISAILGERTSKDIIRSGAKSAVVSAVFSDLQSGVLEWLDKNGYEPDEDGSLLISRQINTEGKNICRINGIPATVPMLKQLGVFLVNIHGQHGNQQLLDDKFHLTYLDRFAAHDALVLEYLEAYSSVLEIDREIERLSIDEDEKARRIGELEYRINEIDSASLKHDEDTELETRVKILRNAEKISEALEIAFSSLYGSDDFEGAISFLISAEQSVSSVNKVNDELAELAKKLTELRYLATDIAEELRDLRENYDFYPGEIDEAENRLDTIRRLKRKYGGDISDVLNKLECYRHELSEIEFAEDTLDSLKSEKIIAVKAATEAGRRLTESRRKAASLLEARITEELEQLDMARVKFYVEILTGDRLTSSGLDNVHFLISANAGEEPRPISRIASGGELSRIMLALKNVLAENDDIQTLIFDEIDSGVSGRAAQRVAEKLASVGQKKQVLCVTHLPQIAAMADTHFLIEKSERNGRTFTSVRSLDLRERATEVARIIGGAEITDITLKNASELIDSAQNYKKTKLRCN